MHALECMQGLELHACTEPLSAWRSRLAGPGCRSLSSRLSFAHKLSHLVIAYHLCQQCQSTPWRRSSEEPGVCLLLLAACSLVTQILLGRSLALHSTSPAPPLHASTVCTLVHCSPPFIPPPGKSSALDWTVGMPSTVQGKGTGAGSAAARFQFPRLHTPPPRALHPHLHPCTRPLPVLAVECPAAGRAGHA